MKLTLPFWDRISDRGKQVLAVLAVLQAVHFAITVPLGIIDGMRFREKMHDFVEVPKEWAVRDAILAQIWMGRQLPGVYPYREDCEEAGTSPFIFSDAVDCNTFPPLAEVIQQQFDTFELDAEQRQNVLTDLELLGGLPPEAMPDVAASNL